METDSVQEIIQLVTILFLLSMVCERIADFLKHYLCGSKLFGIKDTLTKHADDGLAEKARAYRILKINVWSGIIVAALMKADMIMIFNNMATAGSTLGWRSFSTYKEEDYYFLVPGILLMGCFISFGSKFWHDLLDILYQIKNTKRVLSDPETYKVDNIKSLEKIVSTYQSDFVKAAYLEAKSTYMAKDHVKAFSIRSDASGYYFEVTASRPDPVLEQGYQYFLDDRTPQLIPVKVVVLDDGDAIVAHGIDLSYPVFDMKNIEEPGTLGVLVKSLDENDQTNYLVTCFHNITKPPYDKKEIKVGTIDAIPVELGVFHDGKRDYEIDAALIKLNPDMVDKVLNFVPKMGRPSNVPRTLLDKDAANKEEVYMYKAALSKLKKGNVLSVHADIKLKYPDGEHTITDIIIISDNGNAISTGGDSGSCLLDKKNRIVGIIVGGNLSESYAIPIQTILTKLKVQLA